MFIEIPMDGSVFQELTVDELGQKLALSSSGF